MITNLRHFLESEDFSLESLSEILKIKLYVLNSNSLCMDEYIITDLESLSKL